jgi:IS30 family transposase
MLSRSASDRVGRDRAVPGHWEGDPLCGSKNSYIVTLVERHSRYVMLAKVPNRETQTVVDALIRQARTLSDEGGAPAQRAAKENAGLPVASRAI